MIRVFWPLLILVLTFGAVTAPDMSSASMSGAAMAQMETAESADGFCIDCNFTGYADGTACESGCPVPCSSSDMAGFLAKMPPASLATLIDTAVRGAEPLTPLGANPPLDPFPPKLPV